MDAERRNAQVFGSVQDHRASFLQSYRLYVLSLAGSPEFGAMNRMKSVGSKGLAGLYLSAAYLKAGETSRRPVSLRRDHERQGGQVW